MSVNKDDVILGTTLLAGFCLVGVLESTPTQKLDMIQDSTQNDVVEAVGEVENESELIEKALVENGYFSDSIPLSYELQDHLRSACDTYGIRYSIALALIETESGFDTEAGEYCYGLCQLNPRYFPDGLEPYENIQYGMRYLSQCLSRQGGDIMAALTEYNAGYDTGSRSYANKVMRTAKKWEGVLK